MIIDKKMFIIKPKKCYLLLNPVDFVALSEDTYNGEVKIFTSVQELNDELLKIDISAAESIDTKVYKGYLYPGKEFPADEGNTDVVLVIEKIDKSCFVEDVCTAAEALNAIQVDIEKLAMADANTLIADYLIFIGNACKVSFCHYDLDD